MRQEIFEKIIKYIFAVIEKQSIRIARCNCGSAKRLLEISNAEYLTSLDSISEAEMQNWGYIVYKKIWNDFCLDSILSSIASKTKIKYSLSDTSFLMTISHLLCPSSKLSCYNGQDRYTELSFVSLNDIKRYI